MVRAPAHLSFVFVLAALASIEHLLAPISIILVPSRQHNGICRVLLPAQRAAAASTYESEVSGTASIHLYAEICKSGICEHKSFSVKTSASEQQAQKLHWVSQCRHQPIKC